MKKSLYILGLLFVAISNSYGQSGLCDTAYWNHTYYNQRLRIYDSCYTIKGTLKVLLAPSLTGDGDYHLYIQPDSTYQWMVKFRDSSYVKHCAGIDSNGYTICTTCLNVEEICKGTITDGGSVGAAENAKCKNFNDTVYLPNTGEYVQVTGPFVYDTVHCWNELHPVSHMKLLVTGVNEINGDGLVNGLKIFPQPANGEVKFQFQHAPHAITLIKLYSIRGQQLYIYALSETNTLNVDVSTWPTGEYLYSIILKDQNKLLKSGKFSVAH